MDEKTEPIEPQPEEPHDDQEPELKEPETPVKAQLDTVTALSMAQGKKISDAKAALG